MGKQKSYLPVVGIAWSIPIAFLIIYTFYLKYFITAPSIDYGTGSMFDLIAPRYDFVNRVLALNMDISWRKKMVNEIAQHVQFADKNDVNSKKKKEKQTIQILDLATGTADVALLLAERFDELQKSDSLYNRKIKITGVDPSTQMILYGKTKVLRSNMEKVVSLRIGDSRNLRPLFPKDSSVDAITMAFGMRNVPPEDRQLALCEMHRVLKKQSANRIGGKLAILEFSEPGLNHGLLGCMAKLFIRYLVPPIGALLSGASREYIHLQNSIDKFPTPTEFVKIMEETRCPYNRNRKGVFKVKKLHDMNFGSVQLYLAVPEIL